MESGGVVTVCAWCDDKDQRTAKAVALGKIVSHGICVPCLTKLLGN